MKILEILDTVGSDASRNFKIQTLQLHAHNEVLREVVRLALDPFTQFYQRKIPKYTPNTTDHPASLKAVLPAFYDLTSRTVTGNAAINYLQMMLESVSPDDAKVLERIVQKDLKCGVAAGTANAVWGGLIHEYPCMLCSPFEQKLVDKIRFPAYAQLKMDGMRFNAIVRDGKVEFRSRNGKQLNLLGNLEAEFAKLAGEQDMVFDGELLVMFDGDYQFADRQTGNGILNKANKGTISADEARQVHATVWDAIPYMYFVDGEYNIPYSVRFSRLKTMIESQPAKDKKIWLVSSKIVETQDQANYIFQEYLADGLEGIILKDGSGIWENKRAKHQIKYKGELECDLRIVGVEEGTGKYVGMLGAIICESEDGVVKTRVGSGFKDEQRRNLGKEIIGKIAAIKYNMRSVDKQGNQSLFLPIVLEIRDDKDVADFDKDIK
jgi:hypothetical protein